MRSQLGHIGKIIFPVILLLTAQCGGKSKSSDVKISVSPTNPIVFLNDFSYTGPSGNTVMIKGPYFQYTVQIENNSDEPLTLIGLHIEVSGTDETGTLSVVPTDYVPAQDNIASDSLTCIYADYGQFQKKGDTPDTGDHGYSYSMYENPNGPPECPKGPVTFFAPGNPKPASTSTIRYSVVVKPIGYFGKRGAPTDRFTGQATIFTQ